MDDEDLQEQEEAQALQTAETFSGLGSTGDDGKRQSMLMGILRAEGETMGVKLLRMMGWRDGQGVGAKVRRKAEDDAGGEEHLFAPANTSMISFSKKDDRKGLGFAGEEKLNIPSMSVEQQDDEDIFASAVKRPVVKPRKGGIGVGVLNDAGSDDEDPFTMGPQIAFNRVIGGDKKKKKATKPAAPSANPLLNSRPIFVSKKALPPGLRKCHDGRLPLSGFILAPLQESTAAVPDDTRYPIPTIPTGWKSAKVQSTADTNTDRQFRTTASAAKASTLNPKARAALLGEAELPGKSVFDFLSPAARNKIASATGKSHLPAGLGESIPLTGESHSTTGSSAGSFEDKIPELDKNIALSALGRGIGGWTPYADNPAKMTRYRQFLEYKGGLRPSLPEAEPSKSNGGVLKEETKLTSDVRLQELHEFAHAARVFRPMTGMMASRFTSSSAVPPSATSSDPGATSTEILQVPQPKPKDPAEAAAQAGMFGPLTRSILPFAPTRLLCKRFGVKAPAHVAPDGSGKDGVPVSGESARGTRPSGYGAAASEVVSREALEEMMRSVGREMPKEEEVVEDEKPRVDVEKNEAIEGKRAGEELFKAVFGDDDDDEE
jgi:G patch domain-containing protein 1